ncbi:MAG: dihydrofolate reductase [Hyphomicrobiales bacterium]|nr:dihydrofolate reductase [Hyphomicrobiales bacterium]
MSAKVTLVLAVSRNGIIGRGDRLPWRMPSDLKHFRATTMGKPVIMGRKTFQSIGRPLDGRTNIVVSRDASFIAAGVIVASSLEDALTKARVVAAATSADEIIIAGGAQIYAEALPLADRIRLNRIDADVDGDAHFPDPDPAQWREVSRTALARQSGDDHDAVAVVLERR